MATHSRGLNSSNRFTALFLVMVAGCCIVPRCARAAEPFEEYDLVMFERPSVSIFGTVETTVPLGHKELWLKALDRPGAELQRMVVDTLAIGHKRGMKGLSEAKPRMLELAKKPDQNVDVLRAIAQALIVMDQRDQAEMLAKLALEHGASIGQIVEPALGRWKSPVMQTVWLERVTDANSSQTMMTLAINGLGMLEVAAAADPITKLLKNTGESLQLRITAARVLGDLHTEDLVDLAQSLLNLPSRPPELHPLLAIELLGRHDNAAAIEMLTKLVSRDSTVVQSESLERLYEIDFRLVDQHAEKLISSKDANVRRWIAKAMMDQQDVGRIGMLCSLLDDVNPSLRRQVATGLIKLAEIDELREEIIVRTMDVLNQDQWRGCEQAVVVLTRLDHKPSGERMVELLGHERGDVQVAAAWGLSKLRIEKLLPDMLDHAQSVYEGFRSGQLDDNVRGASLHIAHLFIAFGDQRFKPADALMRNYLPKDFALGLESRPAAAWALGMIYEDDVQEDLLPILVQRLNDSGSPEPEDDGMRWMCATALGRMKAESALPSLRKNAVPSAGVGYACYWAIERMTGEKPPPPENVRELIEGFFLMPIPDERAAGS